MRHKGVVQHGRLPVSFEDRLASLSMSAPRSAAASDSVPVCRLPRFSPVTARCGDEWAATTFAW